MDKVYKHCEKIYFTLLKLKDKFLLIYRDIILKETVHLLVEIFHANLHLVLDHYFNYGLIILKYPLFTLQLN